MSYRTITVDNVDYQFVIGKTHVKVRGFEAVLKEEVGQMRDYNPMHEDSGYSFAQLFPNLPLPQKFSVTPVDVWELISMFNRAKDAVKAANKR